MYELLMNIQYKEYFPVAAIVEKFHTCELLGLLLIFLLHFKNSTNDKNKKAEITVHNR